MIVIVDCEVGNLGSVLNMIKKAGGQAVVSDSQDEITEATKLILPGVACRDQRHQHRVELALSLR